MPLTFVNGIKYKKHSYFGWAVYPASQVLIMSVSGTFSDLKVAMLTINIFLFAINIL